MNGTKYTPIIPIITGPTYQYLQFTDTINHRIDKYNFYRQIHEGKLAQSLILSLIINVPKLLLLVIKLFLQDHLVSEYRYLNRENCTGKSEICCFSYYNLIKKLGTGRYNGTTKKVRTILRYSVVDTNPAGSAIICMCGSGSVI
jgi:hypothetical protein